MTDGTPPAATPSIPSEFLAQRQGTTFVTYRGLVHLGHQQGLSATSTTLVQLPTAENGWAAVVSALVTTERGTFAGLGDATPENVPVMIRPHLIRMAETRALARALRVATNAAYTALEELGDDAPPAAPRPAPTAPAPGAMPEGPDGIVVNGQRFSRDQVWRTYSQRRVQALNAGKVTVRDAVAGLVPESRLADLVGASQRLRKLVEPPPELEPDPEEPGGERG